MVAIRTTPGFNVHNFYILLTQCIYVFYAVIRTSSSSLYYTTFSFLQPRWGIFTAPYELNLNVHFRLIFLSKVSIKLWQNVQGTRLSGTEPLLLQYIVKVRCGKSCFCNKIITLHLLDKRHRSTVCSCAVLLAVCSCKQPWDCMTIGMTKPLDGANTVVKRTVISFR